MLGFIKNMGMSLDQIVVEHMKKKYNEEFEIVSREYASFFQGFDSFSMRCKSFTGKHILVEHRKKGIIQDNYMSYYYQEQHRVLMQGIMEGIIGECVVYAETTNYTTTLGLECPFEVYRSTVEMDMGITVYASKDKVIDFEEVASKCQQVLKDQNIVESMLLIYLVRNDEDYMLLQQDPSTEFKGLSADKYTKQYYMGFNQQFEFYSKHEDTYGL